MVFNAWAYVDSPHLSEEENRTLESYFAQSADYIQNLDAGQKAVFDALVSKAAGDASSTDELLTFPLPASEAHRLFQEKLTEKFGDLTETQKSALSPEQLTSLTHSIADLYHIVTVADADVFSRLVDTLVREDATVEEITAPQMAAIYDTRLIPRGIASGLGSAVDTILNAFEDSVEPWIKEVKLLAYRIFLMLIGLDFIWMILKLMMKDNYIDGLMRELAQKVLMYSLGWFLVFHGDQLVSYGFKFFTESSQTGVGGANEINIASFFDKSILLLNDLLVSLLKDSNDAGPVTGVLWFVGKLVLILGLAFMVAFIVSQIIAAYAEMYITTVSTIVLFAFFVSDWTREITQKAIMHNVAMGFRLFSTLLLAAMSITIVDEWLKVSTFGSFTDLLIAAAVIYICIFMLAKLPATLGAIVSMTSVFSPGDQIASAIRSSTTKAANEIGGFAQGVRTTRQEAIASGKPMSIAGAIVSTAGGIAKNMVTGVDRETESRRTHGQRHAWSKSKELLKKVAASQGNR